MPEKKMKVWWNPQIGRVRNNFEVEINSVEEGVKIMNVLADYDLYQLENRIKPDFANMGGLIQWEDTGNGIPGWSDWYDEETGCDDPKEWVANQRICPKCQKTYFAQGCNECPKCGHEWTEGVE